MISTNRLHRFILAVPLMAISGIPSNAAASPRIVPLRTEVTFSSESPVNHWSVQIKTTDGRAVYALRLEPDFSLGNHLATLSLVLRHSGDKAEAPNLLDPMGIWHGMQSCDFAANDLAHGAQQSAFGAERTIVVKNLGLVVRITIAKAMVSPISASDYELDALDLQIVVNNVRP